jgi:hypothetical protein
LGVIAYVRIPKDALASSAVLEDFLGANLRVTASEKEEKDCKKLDWMDM